MEGILEGAEVAWQPLMYIVNSELCMLLQYATLFLRESSCLLTNYCTLHKLFCRTMNSHLRVVKPWFLGTDTNAEIYAALVLAC